VSGLKWISYPRTLDSELRKSIHIREIRMAACPCNSSAIHTVLQSFAYPESVHWSERLDIVSERDTQQFEVEDDLSRESVL
jgi:nuclear transport factor 2 (NTF2) superfamily protein